MGRIESRVATRPIPATTPTAPTPTPAPEAAVAGDRLDLADTLAQAKVAAETAAKNGDAAPPPASPTITRPAYTGGAPALKAEQMDEAVIKNNLILRALYAVEDKAPWALKTYSALTKVLGPIGAVAFFGFNVNNTIKFLKDPKSPALLKGGIVTATALSGVSAATAVRLGASALNIAPMATESLKTFGRLAGLTGVGAGAVISAMDTYNTFRDPNSTAAQKGFSILGTAASGGLLLSLALGVTGPLGLALGIGAVAFPLLKGFLGKNAAVNRFFTAAGHVAKKAVEGVKHVGESIAHGVAKVGGALKRGVAHVLGAL